MGANSVFTPRGTARQRPAEALQDSIFKNNWIPGLEIGSPGWKNSGGEVEPVSQSNDPVDPGIGEGHTQQLVRSEREREGWMPLSCCNCCSGRPARSPRRLRPADVPRPREPELQPEPEPELGESGAAAGTRVPSRPSRRLSVCRSLSALSLSLGLPVLTCLCASSGGAGEQKVSWVKMAREGYGEVLVSPSLPLSLPLPLSLSLSLSLSLCVCVCALISVGAHRLLSWSTRSSDRHV